VENSILNSTKAKLGLAADYTAFDVDIIDHINSAFSDLASLGIGPVAGFAIEDDAATWADFFGSEDFQLNSAKTYVFLKVRMIFDPPATSYLVTAMEKQLEEIAFRLNVHRESTAWVDPDPPVPEEVP